MIFKKSSIHVTAITDAKGGVQLYSYYPGGRLKSVVLPCGESEIYEDDKNGNIIKASDALGNETSLVYDCLDRASEIINPLGRLVAAVHGDATKRYRYDELGNRISN